MKRVIIELPESHSDAISITAVGFDLKNIRFRSLDEKLKAMSPELTSLYNDIKNDFFN